MSKGTKPTNMNPSKIIGIQFSILSPEEIRKGSVAEITTRDTYVNNKPIIGGLFDPRMGVLEPGLICPTDGLDYMQTPGYFGHIELAKPVFYIQYLSTILKILRCACFKCSKLLISKEKYKQALKLTGDARWKYVFSIASKIKRCGEDIEDGCGCLQPNKIRKEGLATIYAEWKNDASSSTSDEQGQGQGQNQNIVIKLIPEIVLKIFKRISDEDVSFMGFSPIWARPDWMICQVMAVPPPAVRPSVKHDAQQRSEDDLSHILVNIIKTNKTLQEKIQNNAAANIIEDWTTVLQYYVATQVDNKIPGVASVAQRSGRPLKSIKDRLNGKGGRMRGNLMAKRVDFSARSVITADPNISIRELGIPMKIAKNITKPVVVNNVNRAFLTKLVQNGPEIWPGAKILEKKNGDSITLRYIDKKSIVLENGDIVHRHMMDGDPILFNRQPTLHRMSMMCHIAKVMKIGDTFRMNVAVTKPYNADFDGDEMNLHMPQDAESDAELLNLAAVPYQIISPANNSSIIGIFQDSMLGCYRFTRENIHFKPREAMNLLMMFPRVNEELFINKQDGGMISNFEILSQILPPISLKYKTKLFNDSENPHDSNNVLEIHNGKYIRGQMEKSVLGAGTKGLIHRVCNDYGNMASANFIDDLQNIITEYLKTSSFSVGISDLLSDDKTNQEIISVIDKKKNDVKNLIDQTQIGVFENNTGKTNEEEFETQVNNILNQATSESGKIGLKSLNKDNRFVTMVNAGSKGSDLNISFMISCLGQQNVDGKRIPYGFDHRTLPHFTKYDDTPSARGFVESSYINGLSPQELFFHAMGGRIGLIDTAVKTSSTGYIQRRLIKGLEDLMVSYDMTVRTNKGKIVEFTYGDDNIDPIKVENQMMPLVSMSIQDIYAHYNIPDEAGKMKLLSQFFLKNTMSRLKKQNKENQEKCKMYTDLMIQNRDRIIKNVFKNKGDSVVNCPVAFSYIINNIIGQQNMNNNSIVDITPLEAFQMIEENYEHLEKIRCAVPTELFKTLYYYYLSPKDLLIVKRFNRASLALLLETVTLSYKQSIVAPGEMVGMIAAQSIGEPTTQMTLNTFHFAGVASKSNVTRGVPRIEEILSLSAEPKNPSLTVFLKEEDEKDREKAQSIMYMLEHTKLQEIVKSIEICFDPDDLNTLIDMDKTTMEQYRRFETMIDECMETSISEDTNEKSKWIIRMEINPEVMLEKNLTMDDIHFVLKNSYGDEISCIYSDFNADKLIFRIRMNNILKQSAKANSKKTKVNPLDQSDQIYLLKNFQEQLMQNIVIRGIKKINKVILRKIKDNVVETNGVYKKQDIWVLDTIGTNMLDILALDYIDSKRTFSNDIIEVYNVFGIEAARQTIYNELAEVIEFDGTYINYHHLCMLCDRMTFTNKLISIFRHGINNDNIGPIAKASFEETPEMFLKAARHAELDPMRGISANVMCGQEGLFGTNAFQVVLDLEEMKKLEETVLYEKEADDETIEKLMGGMEDSDDACSNNNLVIQNNVSSIKSSDLGGDNDYNPGF
uniref:DNA-directed RNA polymerase n=1 Tax=viral metagenome TaxID=1070528 RepID=A0A6C0B149_9ZZZZ